MNRPGGFEERGRREGWAPGFGTCEWSSAMRTPPATDRQAAWRADINGFWSRAMAATAWGPNKRTGRFWGETDPAATAVLS